MSAKCMFTELRRVYSNRQMRYIPKFTETFPELKGVSNEELADRFRELGVEFYTAERKPIPIIIRLTMPFAFVTLIAMLALLPLHYFITGKWRYDLKDNNKLMNWFDTVGF